MSALYELQGFDSDAALRFNPDVKNVLWTEETISFDGSCPR